MTPEQQLKILTVKICHNLAFIKSCIDDKPEEAKTLIDEMMNQLESTIIDVVEG